MAETRARFLANTIGATSASNDFTLPNGVGTNKQVLETDGAGGTAWVTSLTAPSISSVTGTLNVYEDGVSEDGGVLTINGTDFGSNASAVSVQISGTTGFSTVAETSTISLASSAQLTATFTGAETNYNHSSFAAGSTIYVKVTKSGLQTSTYATLGTAMTGDPAFSTTSTTASTHTGTLASTSLGSYGGQVAGGGQDSNTKLLLNFDRTGGTDIEDSSNTSGEGHKITANGNAVIKASPFADGKSAIYFDGVDGTNVTVSSFSGIGSGNFTFEFWFNCSDVDSDTHNSMIMDGRNSSNAGGFIFQIEKTNGQLFVYDGVNAGSYTNGRPIPPSSSTQITENSWHHVALVRSSGTLKLYMDGVEAGSASNSSDFSSDTLTFGKYRGGDGYNFPGYIDEVRVVVGTAVYTGDFTLPTSRLSATQSAGTNISAITGTATKLLIHSNVNTEISGTSNSGSSITSSASGEHGGAWSNATAVNSNVATSVGAFYAGVPTVKLYTTTAALVWTTRKVTIPNYSSTKRYSVSIKIVASDETPNLGFWVGNSTDGTFTTVQTSNTDAIPDTIYESANADRTVGEVLSTGVFTDKGADIYITFSTNQNNGKYVEVGDVSVNEWNDASSSNHTLTPTSVAQSLSHGGIAPALAWPASRKLTGSAGVYFDGNGDYLQVFNFSETLSNSWSFEFYFYLSEVGRNNGLFYMTDVSGSSGWLRLRVSTANKLAFWADDNASQWNIASNQEGSAVFSANTWYHLLFVHDTAPSTNTYKIFIDGSTSADISVSSNTNIANTPDELMIGYTEDSSDYLKGYIDSFRWHSSALTAGSTAKPTKIYGAYRSQDVGTIQLNATAGTGGGALDYAELAGGTALSTYGLSLNESTGAITGTLSGLDDNSNSGGVVRIRARANADDNRVTTLGGSSFTGITQNDGKAPVLFSARRFAATGTDRTINGFGFQPDLCWIKARDKATNHYIQDSVRGPQNLLLTNDTNAEFVNDRIDGFVSDGVRLTNDNEFNDGSASYSAIAWAWKAGTSFNVTTSGSGYSGHVGSKNTAGGFSIVKITCGSGTTDNQTVTHGLDQAPDFIIGKTLGHTYNWDVYHKDLSSNNKRLKLNSSDGESDYASGGWNVSGANFNTGGSAHHGASTSVIYYCFHAVPGVSAFGTYEGNSSGYQSNGDGGVSNLSFKPRWVMVKGIDNNSRQWVIHDAFRVASDTKTSNLYANLTNGDDTDSTHSIEFHGPSNGGFRFNTNSTYPSINGNNETYIYAAFA